MLYYIYLYYILNLTIIINSFLIINYKIYKTQRYLSINNYKTGGIDLLFLYIKLINSNINILYLNIKFLLSVSF